MNGNKKILEVKRTVNGVFNTQPIWQYDKGHVLKFVDFDLPEAFQVHFSNTKSGESITWIGYNNQVDIPDQFAEGTWIYAWLYIVDEDSGLTKFTIITKVEPRAKPSNIEPDPEPQSVIDQTIAVLNRGVEHVQEIADGINTTIEESLQNAKESGEFDGFSPEIEVSVIEGGHRITVTDAEGTSYVDVMDGVKGDGIESVRLNPDYTLTIYYTNGTSYTTDSIRGEKGEKGDTGDSGVYIGAQEPVNPEINVWLNPVGEDRDILKVKLNDQWQGIPAIEGRGIKSIVKTGTSGETDTYTITYSDNTTFTFQLVHEVNGEAYAIGTRNGAAVRETDPAYHNNAKYYAEQAGSYSQTSGQQAEASGRSATAAAQSERNAADSASSANRASEAASQSKTAAAESERKAKASEEAAAESERKSKASEEAAAESERKAKASEEAAGTSEENAEGWAVGQRGGTDVPNTDPTYHNNAKYYAGKAEETLTQATDTIRTEKNAAVEAVQQKGQEVLNSIPADYTELDTDVTRLKSDIQDIAQEDTAQVISELVAQITVLVRQIAEEGGSAGNLNGFSLSMGAGGEVILSYVNPEDEEDTASAVMPTGTTQEEILSVMQNITGSLKIWAGGAA